MWYLLHPGRVDYVKEAEVNWFRMSGAIKENPSEEVV